MTKAFEEIWSKHIPESERDAFRQGGYFSTEVIPGELAVISLNTLYWYDNNAAVRGCKGKQDPGSLHLVSLVLPMPLPAPRLTFSSAGLA